MGSSASLRQLMRSLCCNTLWKYAVFWKLEQHNNMFLTLKDSYCENSKPLINYAAYDEFFAGTRRMISFGGDINAKNGEFARSAVEVAVANMASHSYKLGQGIVGNAALTGEHSWILTNHFNFKTSVEYPKEWRPQITAGIKTILLIPVLHGVVQLGSLETVAEDFSVVLHIKELFSSVLDTFVSGIHSTLNKNTTPFTNTTLPNQSPSLVLSGGFPIQSQSQPSTRQNMTGFGGDTITKEEPSPADCHLSPPFIIENSSSQANFQHILGLELELPVEEFSWNPTHNSVSVVPTQDCLVPNPCFELDDLIQYDCQISEFAVRNTIDQDVFSEASTFVNSFKTDLHERQFDTLSFGGDMSWSFENGLPSLSSHGLDGNIVDASTNFELGSSIGMSFMHDHDNAWNSGLSTDGLRSSTTAYQICESDYQKSYFADINELWFDENDARLLEPMVANQYYSPDENVQHPSQCRRSPSNSSGNFAGSCLTQNKYENDVLVGDDMGPHDHVKTGAVSGIEAFTNSPTRSSSKSGSIVTNEEKNTNEPRHEKNRVKKLPHLGKRKYKADDNKQRPRDRQLIQDRVKELRELVPQGEKCSIDALLDRTIKHMSFLRSVSCQAEKLKSCANPKVSHEKVDICGTQSNNNGATWAYELGTKPDICPILVENLDQPGHMLIEMLCADYGDFLEIAQVIKHSELVILKGVMESREDMLWACFVVEASRGFDRMDILWPLMRLMQQNRFPYKF